MSLRRRLLLYLLISAPLVWGTAMLLSLRAARHEVDELFDTEMIRLARQVQVAVALPAGGSAPTPADAASSGESDMRDLAIAVWDAQGRLGIADREGVRLPYRPDAAGFVDLQIEGEAWRVYYLQSFDGSRLVAAGQRVYERDELSYDLTLSQLLPWLAMLPILLVAMAWAVRRSLTPVEQLSAELRARGADELQPVRVEAAPIELRPLLDAMNGLFRRIEAVLAHERRFTADAAHELRTPLAVLRAQWDVLRRAAPGAERERAEAQLDRGLARLDRLVTQMLALARLESDSSAVAQRDIAWPEIVAQAMGDCLALAERRRVELACEGLEGGARPPLALLGDPDLLTVLLRNLLDNAVRYATPGSTVVLRFREHALEVENDAEPIAPAQFDQLGERFHRAEGQDESGSGLGLSIVRRVAALHGLSVRFEPRADGRGLKVTVGFAPAEGA